MAPVTLQTNKPFRPADCRERFWLHRYLAAHGITNYIVDSSSIEVQLSGLIARATTSRATQRVDSGRGGFLPLFGVLGRADIG